ncbi:SH3 domain-containing protein [Chlamydoabsidia padenii]|nr:SH3 domain-containing protein [Chlamydoabsidia padenii]
MTLPKAGFEKIHPIFGVRRQRHYKVLYDYDAQRNDELSLKTGDMVHILQQDSDDWCTAENIETGQQGAVPTNFLEKVNHTPTTTAGTATAGSQEGPVLATVLQDYAAQDPEELSLWKNGVVIILDQSVAEGWWKGDLNGKTGVFPADHVKLIDAHEQVPDGGDNDSSRRQSFKLAAYGVKQGGIGSILAGGFSLRKKGAKKDTSNHEEPKPTSSSSSSSQQQQDQQQKGPSQQPAPVNRANEATETQAAKENEKAMVTSPYDPQNEDELQLLPGAYITITDKMDDQGWWKGLNEKNEEGVFPSNFVQIISKEAVPPRPTRARPPTIKTDSQSATQQQSPLVSPTGMAKPPPVPVGTRPSSLLTRRPTTNSEQPAAAPPPRPITSPPLHSRRTNSSVNNNNNNQSPPHKRTPSITLLSPDLPPIRQDSSHDQHPARPSRPVPSPGSVSANSNQVTPTSPTLEERPSSLAKVPKSFGKHQAAPSPPPRTSRPNSQASSINTINDTPSLHALADDYYMDNNSPTPPPRAPKRTMPSVPSRTSIPEEKEEPRQHSRESSTGSNESSPHKADSLPPTTGLNLVVDPLEIKLRQWFKEEADAMRQEFESRLNEERAQREKLELELETLKRQLS